MAEIAEALEAIRTEIEVADNEDKIEGLEVAERILSAALKDQALTLAGALDEVDTDE